jgi:hypothetical protein
MLVIPATQEAEIRGIAVGSQSRQLVPETLFQKCPTLKGLVECLLSKHEALSSNPCTSPKRGVTKEEHIAQANPSVL